MDHGRLSSILHTVSRRPSRRQVLRGLAGNGGAMGAAHFPSVLEARRGTRSRKLKVCHNGNTIKTTRKKAKKLLKKGAIRGACFSACSTRCPAGSICLEGRCQPCTVRCDGDPEACGDALQAALNTGGTVYACPGRYVRNFLLVTDTTLIGAGDGMDPSTSTILDAQGSGRVLGVGNSFSGDVRNVRITGGKPAGHGGGIRNDGNLTLTRCTIDSNHAPETGAVGGGIATFGTLTLRDCTVSRNTSAAAGGGIFNGSGSTVIIQGSTISGNTSNAGGGLSNGGTATFDSTSRVTGNTARVATGGGGIYSQDTGSSVTLNGADVSGNVPENCVGVPGCAG
jgi:hypothetical protein